MSSLETSGDHSGAGAQVMLQESGELQEPKVMNFKTTCRNHMPCPQNPEDSCVGEGCDD
jgi:hypothetical protein